MSQFGKWYGIIKVDSNFTIPNEDVIYVAFEAKEYTVDRLLNDAIYCIPRNQRRYVWSSENWTDMYDDILLVADGVASSHFIGSIVLKDEGKEDGLAKYTVIDGQQRILTLTIFLIATMFVMKKRDLMDDFGGTQKYLVAKDIKNKYGSNNRTRFARL